MVEHMLKLKKEYPHLKSSYAMSPEQKMALKKRQDTEREIESKFIKNIQKFYQKYTFPRRKTSDATRRRTHQKPN